MNPNYTEHVLGNGLTVLLKEIHSAPLISHWIWYRVGSRLEQPGRTGVSHWVEHMQFKGTEKYPDTVLDREISRNGGLWNAFTYTDWTAFYETMPADKIDLAISLEADRVSNSLFDPEEVESERTVILSEREGSENDPTFRLRERLLKTAFPNHPYRHEVIGETEDLRTITRDDLYEHYRKHYVPNNAVLVMAGDFDSDDMMRRIEKAWQGIPARPVPEYTITPEGPIPAPQTIEEHGPCDVTILQIVWRAPAGKDPDIFPLAIFDSVLSGPSSLNMFGKGHISNRTSRLYRALVQSGKAADTSPRSIPIFIMSPPTFRLAPRPKKRLKRSIRRSRTLRGTGSRRKNSKKPASRPRQCLPIPVKISPTRPTGWDTAPCSPVPNGIPVTCRTWKR